MLDSHRAKVRLQYSEEYESGSSEVPETDHMVRITIPSAKKPGHRK
jgi:hypothetical protein